MDGLPRILVRRRLINSLGGKGASRLPDERFPLFGNGARIVSGMTSRKRDLEVQDELAPRKTDGTRIWFFNPDYVFPDDRILPGVRRMVQTPALAEYSGSRLVGSSKAAASWTPGYSRRSALMLDSTSFLSTIPM